MNALFDVMRPRRRFDWRVVKWGAAMLLAVALVLSFWTNRVFTGVIYDPDGHPVRGAVLTLQGPTGATYVARTGSDGRFAFALQPALPARYALLLCAPGLSPMFESPLRPTGADGVEMHLGRVPPGMDASMPWEQSGWHAPVPAECRASSDSAARAAATRQAPADAARGLVRQAGEER